MKLVPLIIAFFIFSNSLFINAQETEKPATVVEIMPEFPGGQAALFNYLKTTIKYPKYEKENNITGKVYVYFVIDTLGKAIDVKIDKGASKGIDNEALRVIQEMPNWSVAKQDGKKVKVQFIIPINFTLSETDNSSAKVIGQIFGGAIGFAGGYLLVNKLLKK